MAGKPFAIIGVNSDRDREKLKETLEEKSITWRSFWNGPEGTRGPISKKWKVRGWPTIYVLDTEGKIRFKNVRGEKLDRALEKLMAEAGHEVDLSEHEDPLEAKKKAAKEAEEAKDKDSKEEKEEESKSEKKKDDKGE